jgi:vacuolar iron transporter family protein
MAGSWLHRVLRSGRREDWSTHARESILDMNDGIATAAGIAEGVATAGASNATLLVAGLAVLVAGGFAAAGARYSEARTEWEMNSRLLEAERASIAADPEAELEELVGIYEEKGLPAQLAWEVAKALMQRDPVAAHADAELRLDNTSTPRSSVFAGLAAGLSYAFGAAVPIAVVTAVPVGPRVELTIIAVLLALGLTGWFTAWLTELSAVRLVCRNLALGVATLSAGLIIGLVA